MEVDKTIIFHFLDLTKQKSYVTLSSCGSKIDHKKCLPLVHSLLEMNASEPHPHSTPTEDQTHKPFK
jgi:hypothetical protein